MSEHQDTPDVHHKPWEDQNAWLRILYMLLFGFIFWFCHFIVFGFAIIETIHRLITGETCGPMQSAAKRLGLYVKELADFLLYNSDRHPFPLSDYPSAEPSSADKASNGSAGDAQEVLTTATEKAPAQRKKASRKKKSSTKKTASKSRSSSTVADANPDTDTATSNDNQQTTKE